MSWADALANLDPLAEHRLRDPAASLEGARAVLAEAERKAEAAVGDVELGFARQVQAKARTVIGLAYHNLSDLPAAVDSYLRAIEVCAACGLPDFEAVARACLAPSVLSAGDAGRAEQEIARAEELATAANRGVVAFYHGIVLERTGRLGQATTVFAQAIRWLEEVDDQPTLALAYSNQAVLFAYHGRLAEALESLAAAQRIERQRDLRVLLAMDTHNMGFTLQRLGRLPEALAAFDRAEEAYAALGDPDRLVAVLQADRCEALLLAGMVTEALEAARRAVDALAVIGDQAHLAECRLLLAQALLAGGNYREAASEAATAARSFTDASRPPWAALARYAEIQADILEAEDDSTPPPEELLERCRQIAGELASEGWPVESVHVRTFAGRVALDLGRPDVARQELVLAAPARRRGTADLRARAWLAMALLRLAEGDRGGAKRALSQGFSVVENYVGSLGATELRVSSANLGADLARTGLRLALEDRRAGDALRWAERWRSRAMARPPVRPPEDERLAAELVELRQVRAQLRDASLHQPSPAAGAIDRALDSGGGGARLRARAAELERSVRRRTLQAIDDDTGRTGRIDVAALREALGERWLVEFVSVEGVLYAVTANRSRLRLHRLGGGSIDDEKRYLLFALRRILTTPGRPGAAESLAATAARLDTMLFGRLRIPPAAPVVVVPTGALHGLPWAVLPTLTGRPVTVAPSAAIWLRGTQSGAGDSGGSGEGAVVLIAGPQLPCADDEVRQLSRLYGHCRTLVGPDATAAAVLAALERADVAHLAAHGSFRSDSPMFSSVLVADGPITVYDLERLPRAPKTVVVAACDAAVSAVRVGDGLLGTAAALIGLGVRSVIAPVMPVPDCTTTPAMLAVHRRLRAGDSPAQALAEGQLGRDLFDVGAAFICIGCNDSPNA